MIYQAFVTLGNDCRLSILKRYSQIKESVVMEFAAFNYCEDLDSFDQYAWPYWKDGQEIDWRKGLKEEGGSQVFEFVPMDKLQNFINSHGIKELRSTLNEPGFIKDFGQTPGEN